MHYVTVILIRLVALIAAGIGAGFLYAGWHKSFYRQYRQRALAALFIGLFLFILLGQAWNTSPSFDFFTKTVGPGVGPQLPITNAIEFLSKIDTFPEVDVAKDPTEIEVKQKSYDIFVSEVINEVAPGVYVNSWTFNNQVPGPMLRSTVGDTVTVNLFNKHHNLHTHSIDFHSVTGPGGGAKVLQTPPGETRSITFKTIKPGAYVYHCATPNVGVHMAHGMYGLFLVEPEGGYPPVDREFYIMQGEVYASGNIGKQGLQVFDTQRYLSGDPTYMVFNGRKDATQGKR